MAFANPATDPPFFGITHTHWSITAEFSRTRKYVIALRTGKKAAVKWIEQRMPAKPQTLAISVDPGLGLLLAKTEADRDAAWEAGFPVLERSDRPGEFVARLAGRAAAFAGLRFSRAHHRWAQARIIIDPETRLPITSDYDLAAIVDTEQFDYAGTYASIAGGRNRTNVLVESVSAELNRRYGSRRIMHGSQAQYSGSVGHHRSPEDDDQVLIFHPDGEVEHVIVRESDPDVTDRPRPGAAQAGARPEPVIVHDTDLILPMIFARYFPDKAHVFRQ